MHSNYIVRVRDGLMCFYHSKERGVLCKKYMNGRWGSEEIIVKGARENFSVALGDSKVYLFSQDATGNILMAQLTEDEWSVKTVLENKKQKVHNVLLYPLIAQNGLTIIYNSIGEDRTQYLIKQHLQTDGQWSPASRIDKFIEMNNHIYTVQKVSDSHLLIFYQTRSVETNLGYREMTNTQQGDYNVFHSTAYFISDASFLTTNVAIHVLYIVKSMFSSQLIYRKKTNNQFSNPLVLYEGQRIENCLLTISYDNIYATFQANSQLYICMSEDRGETFSRPAKYRKKFCLNPIKAVYVTEKPQMENLMFVRDLYVDKTSPWDIQLVENLYDDFFPQLTVNREIKKEASEPDNTLLLNQISALQWRIDEKDKQLSSLTSMIATRSKEMERDASELKQQYKRIFEENKSLTERLSEMSAKYETLLHVNRELTEQQRNSPNKPEITSGESESTLSTMPAALQDQETTN